MTKFSNEFEKPLIVALFMSNFPISGVKKI